MGFKVVGCDNFNAYYSSRLKNDRVSKLLRPRNVECLSVELSDALEVNRLFDRYEAIPCGSLGRIGWREILNKKSVSVYRVESCGVRQCKSSTGHCT